MQKSYTEILRSTALIGLSSGASIVFAILRAKAFAVLLGPAGMGIYGLYGLIADLAANIAGLGVSSSGVRQIAQASAGGDGGRIAATARLVNRVSIGLGLAGAALVAALALPIARFTFGTPAEAGAVALLGLVVLLRLAAGGPTALIQGMRRIGDLSRMQVIGGLAGTVVAVPVVYVMGEEGIVPSLIGIALVSLLAALWYARKIALPPPAATGFPARSEAVAMIGLGFAFMTSALLTVGTAYLVRILILRQEGTAAAGLYQAAWAIGGVYAGFILQAMGTDFFPRLTAAAHDHPRCNRLVNEQAEISILLAGPGLVATMTFAPLVLELLYSAEFAPAVSLLRWLCLGMLLRVFAWPMGYVLIAKGARRMFLWAEIAAAVVNVGLTWLLLPIVGLDGAGLAFVGLYVWHGLLVYVLARRLTGFACSPANLRLGALFLGAGGLVFATVSLLPEWPATGLGLVATLISGLYALFELARRLPAERLPGALRPLLARLSLRGAAADSAE